MIVRPQLRPVCTLDDLRFPWLGQGKRSSSRVIIREWRRQVAKEWEGKTWEQINYSRSA